MTSNARDDAGSSAPPPPISCTASTVQLQSPKGCVGEMAVDDSHIYMLSSPNGIYRVDKRLGYDLEQLPLSLPERPSSLAVDSSAVYWGDEAGGIFRLVKQSGDVELLAQEPSGHVTQLRVVGDYLFYLDVASPNSTLKRVDAARPSEPVVVADSVYSYATDETTVCYFQLDALWIQPLLGGAPTMVGSFVGVPVAMDADHVYVWRGTDSEDSYEGFWSFPKAGGLGESIAEPEGDVVAFAASETTLFWTSDMGVLWRVPLRAPSQAALVTNQAGWDDDDHDGLRVELDDAAVYWTGATRHLDDVECLQLLRTTCCGDGGMGGSEECDDGNQLDGDGCNADCRLEPGVDPRQTWDATRNTPRFDLGQNRDNSPMPQQNWREVLGSKRGDWRRLVSPAISTHLGTSRDSHHCARFSIEPISLSQLRDLNSGPAV